MKKLICLFLLMFLFSCEKQEATYCWRCELYTSFLDYTKVTIYCDKTIDNIIAIEKEGSDIFTTTKCTRY